MQDGDYDVYLYRTWKGECMPAVTVTSAGAVLTVKMPELVPVG